jgi:hypothetical protein
VRIPRKLLALALVVLVLAIGAVGWLGLRPHGPTDFAGGARVELADYRGGDPTGAPPSIAGTDMVARQSIAIEVNSRRGGLLCPCVNAALEDAAGMPRHFGNYATIVEMALQCGLAANWTSLHQRAGEGPPHARGETACNVRPRMRLMTRDVIWQCHPPRNISRRSASFM